MVSYRLAVEYYILGVTVQKICDPAKGEIPHTVMQTRVRHLVKCLYKAEKHGVHLARVIDTSGKIINC